MKRDVLPTSTVARDSTGRVTELLPGERQMTALQTSFPRIALSKPIAKMQFAADVISQMAMCCIVGPRLPVGNQAYECRASDVPSAAPRVGQNIWTMSKPVVCPDGLQGRDASHRTRNLDTHLTHGCIQHFRHFSRVRSECRAHVASPNRQFAPNPESTLRTLREAAS